MAKQQETAGRDPERIAQILAEIADRSQQLMQDFAERRCAGNGDGGHRRTRSICGRPSSS